MGRRIKPFTADMEIVDAASDGRAVARHEGRVVFIERGVPGDRARVHVFGKQKRMLLGRIEALEQPSTDRIEARCEHFGLCGGCKWQMMDYAAQLRYKQKQVADAFGRIGKVESGEVLPIIGAESPYYYRNKLEFTFSNKAWLSKEQIASGESFDQRVLGFHTSRAFDKVIDIDHCYLQLPLINDIRNACRHYAREQGLRFYDIRENTGFLRNLIFRSSVASGELMLVLVVGEEDESRVSPLFRHLEALFPQITDFLWIYNPKVNSSYSDLDWRVWKGKEYITERLGGFDFRISPTSFFQTNPRQAERLYAVVRGMLAEVLPAGEDKHKLIYDLYSGTGSIGIYVSALAEKIVGFEYVPSAIEDAWKNVQLNALPHFNFYAGDLKKLLTEEIVAREGKPEVIIADPPRAGMDPKVVKRLLDIRPAHIIYVSCKPATQARDVALLSEAYELLRLQPVDMFPQTAHVENVALLRLKD